MAITLTSTVVEASTAVSLVAASTGGTGSLRLTRTIPSSYVSVVSRAVSGGFATLTTSVAHGLVEGDEIVVSGVSSSYDGVRIAASGTTGTTVRFVLSGTGGTVSSSGYVGLALPSTVLVEPSMIIDGTLTYVDRAVPFASPVLYTAVHTLTATQVASTATASVAPITFPSDEGVCYPAVVSEPLTTGLLQPVTLQIYRPFEYPAVQSVNQVLGASEPIVLNGTRGSARGSLSFITHTFAQAQRIRRMINRSRSLVFRVLPEARQERPTSYIELSNVREEPVVLSSIRREERKWVADFVDVAEPSRNMLYGDTPTWAKVEECYATWSSVPSAEAPTWSKLLYNPDATDC